MKPKLPILLLIATISLLLGSCRCGTDRYGGEFHNIPPEGWAYSDILEFDPSPLDSINPGQLILAVRHTNDYLYSNLYVEVAIDDKRDTFNILLADPFGRWYGRGIGTDFQICDTLYTAIRLAPHTKVAVRHIMRVDTLPDIEQVGISYIINRK